MDFFSSFNNITQRPAACRSRFIYTAGGAPLPFQVRIGGLSEYPMFPTTDFQELRTPRVCGARVVIFITMALTGRGDKLRKGPFPTRANRVGFTSRAPDAAHEVPCGLKKLPMHPAGYRDLTQRRFIDRVFVCKSVSMHTEASGNKNFLCHALCHGESLDLGN
jgi:hypothetical protein